MKFRVTLEVEQKEPGTAYAVSIRAVDPPVLIVATTHTDLTHAFRQVSEVVADRLQEAFDV